MRTGEHTAPSVLVGREYEHDHLREALGQAGKGHGSTVFIIGEYGVGKSRLALAAADLARTADMLVLTGRASSTGPAVPLRPLTEALANLFRRHPIASCPASGDHEHLQPYRSALGTLVPEFRPAGAPAADPEPSPSPLLLGEAVLRLLEITDDGRGCLLVLEDLHDTDPLTLAVVEYLADNLAGHRILLLATFRHEPGPVWDLAYTLSRRRSASLLRLDRLDTSSIRLLMAATLGCPPEKVSDRALNRLWKASTGNPFLAEELLTAMVDSGMLADSPTGWHIVDGVCSDVPATVRRSVAEQVSRLGPAGWELLSAAAVIGDRFPVSVLGWALNMEQTDLRRHLRAAVFAGLLTTDGADQDWYTFRDMLTTAALVGQLTPTDQAAVARRCVAAIQQLHPRLPGEWCCLAAQLTRTAGDLPAAARLFAIAGRRALTAGRPGKAADLLEQAWRLLEPAADSELRVDVLNQLACALVDSGDTGATGRDLRLTDALDDLCGPPVTGSQLSMLHLQFARLAQLGGRDVEAAAHLANVRPLLGPDAPEERTAILDAVEADLLIVDLPGRSEQLADRAMAAADRLNLPEVACHAWQVRGILARRRDVDVALANFQRVREVAENHQLPVWRTRAMVLVAEEEWLRSGDTTALVRAGERARRIGAQGLSHQATIVVALDHALRGGYDIAHQLAGECTGEAQRLGLNGSQPQLSLVRAICAAHQGRRQELDQLLADLRRSGGDRSPFASLVHGMAGALCALLEEDLVRAGQELDEAAARDAECWAAYPLAGQYGLRLLLDVISGRAGWQQYLDVSADGRSRLRWNRQFVLLAEAVLLGRRGQRGQATAAITAVQQVAQPYPVVNQLGLRLVADAAYTDRWGDPVGWLRRAETYFEQAGVPAVVRGCRAQLRRYGVAVPHRRDSSRVPELLRSVGVTEREYEVLQLLADWSDNRSIASQLYISPRTVEKHVASLMVKTGQQNRVALSRHAAQLREQVTRH